MRPFVVIAFVIVVCMLPGCDGEASRQSDTRMPPGDTSTDSDPPSDATGPDSSADTEPPPADVADSRGDADASDASSDDLRDLADLGDTDETRDTETDDVPDVHDSVDGADTMMPVDPWAGCADASDYVGVDQGGTLRVQGDATYCVSPHIGRTLEQAYAAAAQLHFIDGDYTLPTTDGSYPFRLPICLRLQEGLSVPEATTPGTLEVSASPQMDGSTRYTYAWTQPMVTSDGDPWTLYLNSYTGAPSGQTPLVVLDGSVQDPFGDTVTNVTLCTEPCDDFEAEYRVFDSCRFEGIPTERHEVTLDRGTVSFDLRRRENFDGSIPGLYLRADGVIDGVSFVQERYWSLPYAAWNHHISRSFGVIFDTRVAGACGLRVDEIPDAFGGTQGAALTDCALAPIEQMTIIGVEITTLP